MGNSSWFRCLTYHMCTMPYHNQYCDIQSHFYYGMFNCNCTPFLSRPESLGNILSMPTILIIRSLTFMLMIMTKLIQLCIGFSRCTKHPLAQDLLLLLKLSVLNICLLFEKYLKSSKKKKRFYSSFRNSKFYKIQWLIHFLVSSAKYHTHTFQSYMTQGD